MCINYHEFKNETESMNWINKNYKEFIVNIQENSNVDGTLGDALFSYTGSMSKDYNNILRFNNGTMADIDDMVNRYYNIDNNSYSENYFDSFLAKEAKNDIKLIYGAFEINKIADNIILFHYFNMDQNNRYLLKKGNFEIKHFISTTMVKESNDIIKLINKNNYDSLLVIKVKKDTKCIPIGNNPNSVLKECEIILKPRSQFKIEKVRKRIFNKIKYIIECELVK